MGGGRTATFEALTVSALSCCEDFVCRGRRLYLLFQRSQLPLRPLRRAIAAGWVLKFAKLEWFVREAVISSNGPILRVVESTVDG